MRIVEHHRDGCAVSVHAEDGTEITVVEVEARHPDQHAAVWQVDGASVMVVRRAGVQLLAEDTPSDPERDALSLSGGPRR